MHPRHTTINFIFSAILYYCQDKLEKNKQFHTSEHSDIAFKVWRGHIADLISAAQRHLLFRSRHEQCLLNLPQKVAQYH